jgi:HprK-related kinase A
LFLSSSRRLRVQVGPFRVRLITDSQELVRILVFFYSDSVTVSPGDDDFTDFHIEIRGRFGLRRFIRPQITFKADFETPFQPFPRDHALPFFEWGLNWCIASQAHEYLMFHAAVVERDGLALILPGVPGSGKSTLSAALAYRGWRLLSDEFCLYRPESGEVAPIPRPIPLKNESISIFSAFAPDAGLGPVFPKTRKGDVAHVKPPADSLRRVGETARPAWIVFPRYKQGVTTNLGESPKGMSFLKLAHSSFNYELQGARGFRGAADLIDRCATLYLEFSDLQQAVDRLTVLGDVALS